MRVFNTGATRDSSDDKLDYEGFLAPRVLERYAQYMHEHRLQADGQLRASDNWQKGMPREEYVKSLLRHTMELWGTHRAGVHDQMTEDVLCAVIFNAMGLLNEMLLGRRVGVAKDEEAPGRLR